VSDLMFGTEDLKRKLRKVKIIRHSSHIIARRRQFIRYQRKSVERILARLSKREYVSEPFERMNA